MTDEKIYCLDTCIMIWAIQENPDPSVADKVIKARTFISNLTKQGYRLLIPAIVLAELLVGVPVAEQPELLAMFQKKFRIIQFDTAAAIKYGVLWNHGQEIDITSAFSNAEGVRTTIKFDYMIIATAVTNNAMTIVSEDLGMMKASEGIIPVTNLPEIHDQPELF